MKTDIEIAQEAEMLPIKEVAQRVGLQEDDYMVNIRQKSQMNTMKVSKITKMEN